MHRLHSESALSTVAGFLTFFVGFEAHNTLEGVPDHDYMRQYRIERKVCHNLITVMQQSSVSWHLLRDEHDCETGEKSTVYVRGRSCALISPGLSVGLCVCVICGCV